MRLWTAGRPRRRQFAALDPLPDDEDEAGAGEDVPVEELSLEGEVEPSFDDDDEPSFDDDDDDPPSDAEALLRLSVR